MYHYIKLKTEKQFWSADLQFKNELIQHQTEKIKALIGLQDAIQKLTTQEQSKASYHQSQLTATYPQNVLATTQKERAKNMVSILLKKTET